jgi:hypothetical protein
MSKQNITYIPHPYLWGPTDRYTPFYSLFRDKLSLPRELVYMAKKKTSLKRAVPSLLMPLDEIIAHPSKAEDTGSDI